MRIHRSLFLLSLFSIAVVVSGSGLRAGPMPLIRRVSTEGAFKHHAAPRRTKTSPSRRQASQISYPICEGSPTSGATVYGTVTDAVYNFVDGGVAAST
jgi:hypothetical protein